MTKSWGPDEVIGNLDSNDTTFILIGVIVTIVLVLMAVAKS